LDLDEKKDNEQGDWKERKINQTNNKSISTRKKTYHLTYNTRINNTRRGRRRLVVQFGERRILRSYWFGECL
jgi:hypothetical protein